MNTSVKLIYEALQQHSIEVEPIALPQGKTLLYFEYAGKQHAIAGTSSDLSSFTGRLIADNKQASAAMAQRISIPIPATIQYDSPNEALAFLEQYKRIVVKPLDSAHGNGISTGISDAKGLKQAIKRAQAFSSVVLIQQQVTGIDLRVLVINGKTVAVSERVPAGVTGDGMHTVKQLIEIENRNPDRGEYYEKPLNKIKLDAAEKYLGKKKLAYKPAPGENVQVIGTANIGSGGHAVNKTGEIPDEIVAQAERFAQSVELFICGVDFMYDEPSSQWYFIEANGSPSFGLHLWPKEGEAIDVTSVYVHELLKKYDAQDEP